jgi:hypothetical protein
LKAAGQGRNGRKKARLSWIGLGLIVSIALSALAAQPAMAVAPQISATTASGVGTEEATLEAMLNPEGEAGFYHFEYGLGECAKGGCTKVPVPDANVPSGSSPVLVKATVEGLTPGTVYHFRLVAHNATTVKGPDRTFVTYGPPLSGLPDDRAYEQASPTEKDGGDIVGALAQVKASADGKGITFGSTFGIPGGEGAQDLPMYLALRGGAGWSTRGLLPPATSAERAQALGWLPDFSEVFSNATILGEPWTEALIEQSTATGETKLLTPYVANGEYAYAGASADGSVVLFESRAALAVPEGEPQAGASNLYAWDAGSEALSLVSTLNTKAETEAALPRGAFAGPYDWGAGINAAGLGRGGAAGLSYVQDLHAIAPNGDVYFTAAGSGQLYLRENPTQPQSALDGQGECTEPQRACTLHVSATEKENGEGTGGADPAGPQPAAFLGANVEGSLAFFTSPEKLTDDANTGPEQPSAEISRDTIDGNPEHREDQFIPGKHAVGLAVDGSHLYWVDPGAGEIWRAEISDANPEAFITPEATECEVKVGKEEFEVKEADAPRYLAVQGEYVYWTNTGPLDKQERSVKGCGTIGRAKINSVSEEAEGVEPEFITGAFNPEGVAANSAHIYWANAATAEKSVFQAIGRAKLNGAGAASEVDQLFFEPHNTPHGVALDESHVYFTGSNDENGTSFVSRLPLEGGAPESLLLAQHSHGGLADIRGIAVEGGNVYWASSEEKTIGRAPVIDLVPGECDKIPGCERKFIEVAGTPIGLAPDSAHLYWSINGEAPSNPGNDLYRFDAKAQPGERLTDLSAEEGGEGADVQGVLGASRDGSYVYFAANGALAEGAAPGDCHTTLAHGPINSIGGSCNLYLWHEGQIAYLARLDAVGGKTGSDAGDWLPAPQGIYGSGGYAPRSASVSPDGRTLLFRSQEKLSAYENKGVPELYRYRVGDPQIACISCNPAGEAVGAGPSLSSVSFPDASPRPGTAELLSRVLADEGDRAFFESAEALSPLDVNGREACPPVGFPGSTVPVCLDVYEWEAPGAGSCEEGGPSYSPEDEGCLYLISSGKDSRPSFFADASESGEDAFFFTRQQLVGQDEDELQDVYDARVGGVSQNPQPPPVCESAEACHGPAQQAPAEATPATPGFVGPPNPKPKRGKAKKHGKKHRKHHRKTEGRQGR